MSSQPCAFVESRARMIRRTFSLSISRLCSRGALLGKKLGSVLPVVIAQHCLTKYSLKMFALVSMFVTKSPFSRSGGMFENFSFESSC